MGALLQAVTAAEGVSGEKHVRVAAVLMLLAHLYARTARVTLAEGLYRCSSPSTLFASLDRYPNIWTLNS